MAYIRILHDNAIMRANNLYAGSEALDVDNLFTARKSKVWRSDPTTSDLELRATWSTSELINCVVFPFTNLTSAARIRVRLYSDEDGTTLVYNSGFQYPLADLIDNIEWGGAGIGLNAFSFGGGNGFAIWIPQSYEVKRLNINILDALNPSGYYEVSCLSAGTYWSPERGAQYGCTMTNVDKSNQERSDAGDLRTDRGCSYKKLAVDLSNMPSTDKTKLWQTIRNAGKHTPLFVSVVPEADEPTDEQIYQIFGKLSSDVGIKYSSYGLFDGSLDVEEI